MKYDLFISHASEDKNDFVRPLARTLTKFGVSVWYDEFTLSIGDSLSKSIDNGLIESSFGLVILSPDFLKKGWPEYELRALISKEVGTKKVILPIWHKLKKEDLLSYSPYLADKFAIRSDELNIVQLSVEIINVIRPDLFEKIQRRAAYLNLKGKTKRINAKKLKLGPARHEKLPLNLISRIRLIRAALLGVYPHSMEFWTDGFRGDAHPSREIRIWEHIAACYIEYCSMTRLSQEQQKKVFEVVSSVSCGIPIDEAVSEVSNLPNDAA
jgi:TIR domain